MNRREVPLRVVAREWLRIGLIGFGGPPAHISLLRDLVVRRKGWMDARAFEDANAACSLLPGPSSTQLSIFTAYRAGGPAGAVVGGLGFVVPAVVMVLALSVLFLASAPPEWVRGAGAGAGAAVAAVAVRAGSELVGPSHEHAMEGHGNRLVWFVYLAAGAAAAIAIGPYLVLVLVACGIAELLHRTGSSDSAALSVSPAPVLKAAATTGSVGALAWTAFKVGALSFGGGFVIIPLMQQDAVDVYHWMTDAQFLNAVALGQVTPGPVVATVAAVGYAAHGIWGGILAAVVAFVPSFSFILLGGGRFERLRGNEHARAFLDGAGPAAIGAILGSAVTLAGGIDEGWQWAILAAAAVSLLILRRSVVLTLAAAGAVGAGLALAGAPLP
jgi:chromate transporter